MGVNRKLDEPIPVYDAPGRPIPAPVLTNEHRGQADPALSGAADYGLLVTPISDAYPGRDYLYVGSFYAAFYNRVHAVPRTMALVDPTEGEANSFYLWNAFLAPVMLTGITAQNDTGLELSFDVGLSLSDLEIKEVSVVVTPAAPVAANARYDFFFDNGSVTPFVIDLLRTNLLLVAPEVPVNERLSWKTDVITSRNGTEQRFGLRQIARQVLTYKVIYENVEQERQVYEQFFAKGAEAFSVPIWHEPLRLMEDAALGATQVEIDTARYDVRPEDQLYIEHEGGGSYEIVRVQQVQSNGTTVALYTALLAPLSAKARFYRVAVVNLPSKPSLRRGAFQHLESNLDLRVVTDRDIYVGNAAPVEIAPATQLRDRIIAPLVYTLGGVPVIHARPLVTNQIEESFDWNFEITDYETGPVEQYTPRDNAMVVVDRTFHSKYAYQRFFFNYVMNYMHGQRKPVWLPTWQEELNARITSMIGNIVTISDEQFYANFRGTSHRGLWIRHTAGWLARRIVGVMRDGEGNSIVEIEPALPIDFPALPPYRVGFLTLSRLGSDEVEMEHRTAYSLINMTFASTFSTDEGV